MWLRQNEASKGREVLYIGRLATEQKMSVHPQQPPNYLGSYSNPANKVLYGGFDPSQIPPDVLNQPRTGSYLVPSGPFGHEQRGISVLDDFGLDQTRLQQHPYYMAPPVPRFGPAPPPRMSPPYLSLHH
jgi:hypothetical protein